jgi:hypothetical protein
MFTFDCKIREGLVEEIIAKVTGEPMRALLTDGGNDGVAQVRRNIVTEGKPSGSFAPLQGTNEGARVGAKTRNQQRKVGVLDGTRAERARDKRTAKHGVSRHAGYARQKERDHDAGRIPYGPEEKLRRTGDLERSLTSRVILTGNTARVELHAEGEKRAGLSNDDLLSLLAFGTDRMPARNPAVNMLQVEARFAERLRRLLGSANVQGTSG